MKLLPFERKYVLDTSPCPRCAGSGLHSTPSPRSTPECWSCRGLGRRASHDALQLFYAICDLLGKPLPQDQREGRIEPRHLSTIWGRFVEVGMKVALVTSGPARTWPALVVSIDPLPLDAKRLHFADGSVQNVSEFTLLSRDLSDDEIDRVQAFMAEHVGKGAVEATL